MSAADVESKNPPVAPAPTQISPTRRWRLHLTTYVVVFVAVAAMFLANVPGRYVILVSDGPGIDISEHGWPVTYLSRPILWAHGHSLTTAASFRVTSPWPSVSYLTRLDFGPFCVDSIVATLIVTGVGLMTELRMRKLGFRFSIAELMAVTLLAASAFAWFNFERRGYVQEQAIAALDNFYGEDQPAGPWWLRRLLGDDLFRFRDRIVWGICQDAAVLPRVSQLRYMRGLCLESTGSNSRQAIPPSSVSQLRDWSGLISLQLAGEFDDIYLIEVRELRQLKHLSLCDTSISALGVACLSELQNLETLDLSFVDLGRYEADWFPRLSKLQKLDLSHTNLTDESLESIAKLPSLEFIALDGTLVTPEGIARLKKVIPNLETDRDP